MMTKTIPSSLDQSHDFEPLQYQPLDEARSEIRLIRVLKSDNDYIDLEMRTVSPDSFDDTYNAVSYMWGPESPTYQVLINGHTVSVRENIARFFLDCQGEGWIDIESFWFWIDCICINQTDNKEKSAQVTMMGRIFNRARSVYVWLGIRDRIESLEERYKPLAKMDHPFALKVTTEVGLSYEQAVKEATTECLIPSNTLEGFTPEKVDFIMTNPYWTRLWIIQELCLAQQAWIIVDETGWGLRSFSNLALPWKYATMDTRKTIGEYQYQSTIDENIQAIRQRTLSEPSSRSLLHLALAHKRSKCHDPRDKIYGLLAMAKLTEPFSVDYDIHRAELFARTVRYVSQDNENWILAAGVDRAHAYEIELTDVESLMDVVSVTARDLDEYLAADPHVDSDLLKRALPLQLQFEDITPVIEATSDYSADVTAQLTNSSTGVKRYFQVLSESLETDSQPADTKTVDLWLSCSSIDRYIPKFMLSAKGKDASVEIAFVYDLLVKTEDRYEMSILSKEQIPAIVSKEILSQLSDLGSSLECYQDQSVTLLLSPLCMAHLADMEYIRSGKAMGYSRPGIGIDGEIENL